MYFMFGGVAAIIALSWFWHYRRIAKLRRFNYDWYRGEFPDLVTARGVRCYRCNSSNIGTELLKQQTFLRAHVCRQCGTRLYYSQE